MNRHLVVAIAASLALLAATPGAQALPPGGDFGFPGDPVIVDPCDLNPEDCLPPPPVDPCELDPSLPQCQPEPPVDPCDLSPIGCDEEPPVADPGSAFPSVASLSGRLRVRGSDFSEKQGTLMLLFFSDTAFSAVELGGSTYTGRLAPKGTSGAKFSLFLDAPSSDAFANVLAERAADAAGRSVGSVVGRTLKLTLSLDDEGASLKIKGEVLLGDAGAVIVKGTLAGPVEPSDPQ
jgi:hypothetical protein